MGIYKLKFTKLQNSMLRFLFVHPEQSFNLRGMASSLGVSPTAVSKASGLLKKENVLVTDKDKQTNQLSLKLNRENPKVFSMKRTENLKMLYESGLVDYLTQKLPLSTIILFGSYASGEDISTSDIDIAVVGVNEKEIGLSRFEHALERHVFLHYYPSFDKINKNLKSNILNGITLAGAVEI